MSVPLDRLYNYLDDIVNYRLLIYGWSPHGSTKLQDFLMLRDPVSLQQWHALRPGLTSSEFKTAVQRNDHAVMICHDQEPLMIDRYSFDDFKSQIKKNHLRIQNLFALDRFANDAVVEYCAKLGLRGLAHPTNHCDLTLLLHSEQRSDHVEQYQQQGYVPVYVWSHGIIARDWFRYAEHDPVLNFDTNHITHDFLLYNRAWSGTREYRLCMAEQVVCQNLVPHCKTSFNAHDCQHYSQHRFANPDFAISNFELEQYFPANTHTANASADYCGEDYATTGIEVVLETLFDDTRWHLTEKTLRPIACGQPFILMATAGSLQYLRQYGFQTFTGLIDESYDQIHDPRQRLQAVIKEMVRISALPAQKKYQLFESLNHVARHNQRHFFNAFTHQVQQEYITNMHTAMTKIDQHRTGQHDRVISALMQ